MLGLLVELSRKLSYFLFIIAGALPPPPPYQNIMTDLVMVTRLGPWVMSADILNYSVLTSGVRRPFPSPNTNVTPSDETAEYTWNPLSVAKEDVSNNDGLLDHTEEEEL